MWVLYVTRCLDFKRPWIFGDPILTTARDAERSRRFAVRVVETLQQAGYTALWAGGCVRDELMGRTPKDFDVATNARPDQVRALFGTKRTLAIGASFGVISVLGPPSAGTVEVATFRADAPYSDGRHPDHVVFTNPEADAQRRDFTINGLFLNPLTGKVSDFVGGLADIDGRIVRAIGDADARIGEDKLRMLRAVRFAATLGFELDPGTADAIGRHAAEIHVVSGERIAEEMRKILASDRRRLGVELLAATRLLGEIVPGAEAWGVQYPEGSRSSAWGRTCRLLDLLANPSFSVALAALLREPCHVLGDSESLLQQATRRWKLANSEVEGASLCLSRESVLRSAHQRNWPEIQRILIGPRIEESLAFAQAAAIMSNGPLDGIAYCRDKLALPPSELNPDPLITGDDLRGLGIPPGPVYKLILDGVRDEQLAGDLSGRDEALQRAREIGETCGG